MGGIFLAVGRAAFGLPLIVFGATLLAKLVKPSFSQRMRREPGRTSRVRSTMLAMELDLDTGRMRGSVVAGRYSGRDLDTLGEAELADLARELAPADPEGASLFEAYLDRRKPGWRENLNGNAHAGRRDAPGEGPMTEDQAYKILGLDPGAGAADVRTAHRALMKKLHPDQGGSTYLASRVNQAKDFLLRSQR
jgi:DnaJ-domain-containing protein 1